MKSIILQALKRSTHEEVAQLICDILDESNQRIKEAVQIARRGRYSTSEFQEVGHRLNELEDIANGK